LILITHPKCSSRKRPAPQENVSPSYRRFSVIFYFADLSRLQLVVEFVTISARPTHSNEQVEYDSLPATGTKQVSAAPDLLLLLLLQLLQLLQQPIAQQLLRTLFRSALNVMWSDDVNCRSPLQQQLPLVVVVVVLSSYPTTTRYY